MHGAASNTPVIAGVGFRQEKSPDPSECPEALQLMLEAVRAAAEDAGCPSLLPQLESIAVPQGTWQYSNPARLLASELGCETATTILADLGVLQLSPLFELCADIVAGRQSLGVLVGAESKYRDLRSRITGIAVSDTQQCDDLPDQHLRSSDPFATEVEAGQGIFLPTELFAVIESALRHHQGLGIEEHRDRIAALYSGFSEIAAANPHAWKQEVVPPGDIRNAVDNNAMLAFPYTKRHNSQWNVNQSVAIIVCSVAKARELGLDETGWIYPLSGAQSRHVLCLAQQRSLFSHPGTVLAGKRAYELAGVGPQDLKAAELYSCFPAAVQSFALDLGLEENCPWSVTGSMAFAGGPFNHSALDGVARMVEVLRDAEPGAVGLVSNLSGIFGKQAVALFSNRPNPQGFSFADVTDEVEKLDPPLPVSGEYTGPATIAGYTVAYGKEGPSHAFAYCDTVTGERTVARSQDPALLAEMVSEEFVGREVIIGADRSFYKP